ncbi:hypothetical protein N665_0510s0021 [Sinapis alba]|nr:hypothetical protein N665_0510s0021 [Sinapis alba]
MDSGNSSSMQSSSGGGGGDQEEYDSRADQSISALFNNNATTVSSNITGQTQLDSLMANYFNTGWSTDNPLWSTTTTNPTEGYRPPPQPPISSEPVFFTNTVQQNLRVVSNTDTNTNTSTSPICSVPTDKKTGLATTRNPKKRSRVSRRAPTTVLTTDTSNFRAMVQEFTVVELENEYFWIRGSKLSGASQHYRLFITIHDAANPKCYSWIRQDL